MTAKSVSGHNKKASPYFFLFAKNCAFLRPGDLYSPFEEGFSFNNLSSMMQSEEVSKSTAMRLRKHINLNVH